VVALAELIALDGEGERDTEDDAEDGLHARDIVRGPVCVAQQKTLQLNT
jgi:hypothetical protein